jgi:hypothetical protein
MAHPNLPLIQALRTTADRLEAGNRYAWGNHGSCNCGNLLQVVTQLSSEEILRHAQSGIGEWTELAEEACSVTEVPWKLMVSKLEGLGLTPSDIHHLEYLTDRTVLDKLPGGFRWLKRNVREDVIIYFRTLATILEDRLAAWVEVPFDDLLSGGHASEHGVVNPHSPLEPWLFAGA